MEGFTRVTLDNPKILNQRQYTFIYSLHGKRYQIRFEAKNNLDAKCVIIQQLARTKDPRRMRDILDFKGRSII